jgi:heavy metal sensor kinase
MAARALAPLARMAAATRHIDVADLRQRLPVRGTHDELDEVAHAFNDTLTRLDRTMGEMRQFSAAIAHELRTPLAALRGETEVTLLKASSIEDYRRGLTDQLEELDKLARLVSQLMTLARAEAGQIPLARTAVDLSALSLSLVEQLEPVAQARAVTIAADVRPSVIVTGDAGWLERLILNLLDNAIKFTPAQGRIVVRVRSDGESAVLEVEDNGVGIAPEALPHVFERFYRADPARSSSGTEGVGLGLSLVKWIADRHSATLGVQSQPGQGARFTVEFPSLNDN